MDKNKIISQVYHDPLGYGSIHNTLKDARKVDKSITLEDVKQWKESNVERKTQLKGYNSYVADHRFQEYQIDLFFMNDLKDQKYNVGMLMVDIFTKYTEVIPIKDKSEGSILSALMEGFNKMGGPPESVYSDDEPALSAKYTQQFFKEKNIIFITTRTHAGVAERQIRTIKDMLYKRIDNSKDKDWSDHIGYVLLAYNHKLIHNVTKMTPHDARKPKNRDLVLHNIELKAKHNRVYPDIHIGDKVKIYTKKKRFEKERVSVWSKDSYDIEDIKDSHGQTFYKTSANTRPFMRHEILKV